MANKNLGRAEMQIGFSIDKNGLTEMQSLFQQIANLAKEPGNKMNTGLQQAAKTASTLDSILSKTFNSDLGTLNVVKFNQELTKSDLNLKQVKADLVQAGNSGVTAYNRLTQAILGTNQQMVQSSKVLDKMFLSMKNVFAYNISAGIFNKLTGSIEQAYSYAKNLDKSLNDIRIVTDKSAESMATFAENANTAAKNLGANTLDYTNASLIYFQQGLSDAEVAARAETTIKAANVTGQTGEEVSEQLTAVWNGYKVTAEETEAYVDKLAAVAATTAADLEELSVGMSKVASAAESMGVDFDDLNAQIATIVSVTRQAPESVGTALKTIYARLGDLKVDGVDEFGVSLGEVSGQLQQMGIQVLDQQGNLRNMTDVIAEVAAKWNTWTEAQRQAAAVAMAGKRQYNNLIALFNNWDQYTAALNTSQEALGTLQKQQDIYMESTQAKLKTLKSTWQDLYGDLIDEDELNTGIELLTNLVQTFDNFIESFGGGLKSIAGFGAVLSSIFNKQIAESITNATLRLNTLKNNLAVAQEKSNVFALGAGQLSEGATPSQIASQARTQEELEIAKQIYEVRAGLNEQQAVSLINQQKEVGILVEEKTLLEEQTNQKYKSIVGEETLNSMMKADLLTAEEINTQYGERLIELNDTLAAQEQIDAILNREKLYEGGAVKAKQEILALSKSIKLTEEQRVKLTELVNDKQNTNMESLYQKRLQILAITNKSNSTVEEELTTLEKQAAGVEKIYENKVKIDEIDTSIKNKEIEINQAIENAKIGSGITQQVTAVTSSLGNLAMAWSSVNSLMETWNNDSISFGDKLTQTFMTLGMTLPIVISNFSKLGKVFGVSTSLFEVFRLSMAASTASTEANTVAITANTVAEGLRTTQEQKEVALIASKIVEENLDKTATEENTIAQIAKNVADKEAILLTGEQIPAIEAKVAALRQEKVALDASVAAETAKKASILGLNPALLAAAAAIAIVTLTLTAGIKAYENHIENIRKENEEILKNVKEKETQIDANKELYNSYNNLYEQLQKGENVQDSLYDTTLKLADAYDIQGAKILALNDRYDVLINKIKEARKAELETLISEADKGATGAGENAIIAGRGKGLGGFFFDRGRLSGSTYTYQDSLYSRGSTAYKNQQGAIQAAGLEENYNALTGKLTKKIDYSNPEQVKAWMDEVDKMVEYYQNNVDELMRDSDSFYNNLVTEQRELAENGQELIAQLSLKYSGMIEQAILSNDKLKLNEQTTASELLNLKEELKNSLGIPEEEFEEGFKNYLKNIDSIEDAYTKLEIAEQINDKMNEGAEEGLADVLEQIQDFNNAELAYLEAHLDTAILDQDLEEWKEKNKDVLDALSQQETASSFKNILSNYDEKKGITPEQQSAIYSNEEMSSYMPSEDAFKEMDEGDKISAITQAWIESTKAAVEYKEEAVKALKEQQKEIKNQLQLEQNSALINEQIINNKIKGNEELENKLYDIIEVLKKLSSEGYEELDNEEKQLLKNIKDENILTEKQIKEYGEVAKKVDNLSNAYEDYENEIKRIDNLSEDHAENIKALKQTMQKQSGIMDDIQSAYKSLIGVVDDYNESGSFTIDTVQQLMSMDDAYVATLQFENGQLSLNEQAFQALTIAKIDDMEQTAVLTAQEELEKLAEEGVADASMSATSAILNAAAAARDASAAAREGAAAWDEYAASMRAAAGVSGAQYDAKAKQITDALQNRLLAAENAKKQVGKGGSSMRKSMGAGSGSKGGGGGSKGKDRQEKELKNLDEEFDRYWELNKAIEATDRAVQKLEKDQENLHGYELIKSLQNENELLETQKGNYEALLAAQQERAAALRAELGTMGVIFDASGAIVNYAEATANALAAYNAAIQQYNAGLIDETTLGVAEKSFENFKKLLSEYDQLYYNEIQETQDKIDEITRKIKENNLKAWEEEIKIKLDWQELKRGWNDFLKDIKKDFKKVYADLKVENKNLLKNAKTYTKKDGTINTDLKAIKDVEAEIDKMMGGGESEMFESVSQAQEKLKELNEQLQNDARALHELWEQAWQNYLDGIDQVEDKLSDVKKRYEDITEEIEFQGKLIKLLYGDTKKGLELNAKYYEGMIQSTSAQIDAAVKNRDMWKEQFEKSGADINRPDKWNEDQKKLYENWIAAQKELNDLTLQQIEYLQEDYKNAVEAILYDINKQVEDLRDNWEKVTDEMDRYYDSAERAYQIQTLQNKMNEEINKTSDLKNQQKLQALRDKEIESLRNKTKLREIDVKNAELEYEIALKEIALEEAQNNKTSMKLTRNEEGNWAYQYVADEGDVADKQQSLLDSLNSLYQLWDEKVRSLPEEFIELEATYAEKMAEYAELALTNKEEADLKMQELEKWHTEQLDRINNEYNEARQRVNDITAAMILKTYEADRTAYESMTDREKTLVDELKDAHITNYQDIKEAVQTDLNGIGTTSEDVNKQARADWTSTAATAIKETDNVKKNATKAYNEIIAANNKYQQAVDKLAQQVGRDFGDSGIKGAIDKAKDATDNLTDATKDLADKGSQYIDKLRQYVEKLEEQWNKVKDAIKDAIKSIEEYLQKQGEVNQQQGQQGTPGAGGSANSQNGSGNNGSGSGGGSGGGSGSGNSNSSSNNTTYDVQGHDEKGNRVNMTGLDYNTARSYVESIRNRGGEASMIAKNNQQNIIRNKKTNSHGGSSGSFATGGYTGEWGEEGRLATLHQKELVLNKEDTENFLSGISMIRDMASLNGSIEKSILQSIANMAVKVSGINPSSINTNNNSESNNNIFNITAEFPNANNVDDIRQAILTLPNIASQYINTNRR